MHVVLQLHQLIMGRQESKRERCTCYPEHEHVPKQLS